MSIARERSLTRARATSPIALQRAVTVTTFVPGWSTMPPTDQAVVPVAVPLPPRSLLQATCVTPTLSDAVPPMASGLAAVE